jgi:NAD(P)-dependent dehydrogenase (short-subunit alcohol dehydrogenase family)
MAEQQTPELEAVWEQALAALERGDASLETERAIVEAARRIKRRRKIERRHEAQELRDELRAQTGRVAGTSPSSSPGPLPNHAHCYVCKKPFRTLHPYYHLLCVPCGDASFARRNPKLDVEGRRAIVTGGRTKLGYRSSLLLLRGGADVTVTTRYAHDAARRYAGEEDYASFAERLHIERIDFRDVRAVHDFIDSQLRRGEPLDILVNQAAQTIRASANLERLERERDRVIGLQLPAAKEQLTALLTASKGSVVVDRDHGEWVDNNGRNSWDLELEDVSIAEFFEVQLVNVFAPWALTGRLLPLLKASRFPDRYIVQVSAIEGQFHGPPKTGKHPHTNMAKAALHMLVRTSADLLARDGIYMNAVDPGWVSDQSAILRRDPDARFIPPLDGIDGAARILDPIARGLRGDRVSGQLLKDYEPASW